MPQLRHRYHKNRVRSFKHAQKFVLTLSPVCFFICLLSENLLFNVWPHSGNVHRNMSSLSVVETLLLLLSIGMIFGRDTVNDCFDGIKSLETRSPGITLVVAETFEE